MSDVSELYEGVTRRLPAYVFGDEVTTGVAPLVHGDASGMHGAPWLWTGGATRL